MELYDKDGLTEQEFLAGYDAGNYQRPSVAADIAIFTIGNVTQQSHRKLPEKELRILLIKRGGHPYLGCWALPGGFVRPDETVGQAALRELREETGVAGGYLEQLFTFSDPGRDPRTWVMSCTHMALVDSGELKLKAGDDASAAEWFRLSYTLLEEEKKRSAKFLSIHRRYHLELSAGNHLLTAVVEEISGRETTEYKIIENHGLAFDHAKIIACAVERLQKQLEDSALAFNLMPEKFTLTELQQVYEVILGRPLLKAAFRRKVKSLVRETGEYTEHAGHRPSQLFRQNRED